MTSTESSACAKCGDYVATDTAKYCTFDIQNGYEKNFFCSAECMRSWVSGKTVGLVSVLIIGAILAIIALADTASGMQGIAHFLFFLPYMVRHIIKNQAWGAFLKFMIVLLAALTVIYPVYKIYQEIRDYSRYKSALDN